MSNINQNKDDNDAGKEEEVKESNGQSQVLDMIRFDANAVSQQSAHVDARNSDDMTLNSGKSSSSTKHELLSNEGEGACSLLTRSLSSSDLKSASESSKVSNRIGKGGKGSKKYNRRLAQKHYHTMQISYPIDEPSALLPVDVDPPFEGEVELGMVSNKPNSDNDAVEKRKTSNPSSDMPLDEASKDKSSNRRYIRQISSSLTRQDMKAASLPPEDQLGAVGGLPILATTSSSSSSNETSPASSSANSPDVRQTETKSFFPSSHTSRFKSKSVRSKSEDAKSSRNKNSISPIASESSTLSQQVQTSLPDQISHSTRRILAMEDQRNLDWQITKSSLTQRAAHLLESGLWTDCEFHVGLPPNVKVFNAHKMFLGMASPVFDAMFYGGFTTTDGAIKILDVQPEAFKVMLDYIYTDRIHLNSFELVCDICYAAKKYMLPALVEDCTKYLWRDLYPRNACRAYEFAKLFDEQVLMEKGLQIIRTQTREILSETTFDDVEHSTLVVILSQDEINVDEATLFDSMVRWSVKECERRGLEATGEKKRSVLSDALFLIRYLTFPPAEFAAGPATSELLTQEESFAILMNISAPGSWDLPDYLCKEREPRKTPQELLPAASVVDTSHKYWCRRAMMQEPHCLNTSILDCSVTFMVDRDMCIHGIEVPSQATEPPTPQQQQAAAAAAAIIPNQPILENRVDLNLQQIPEPPCAVSIPTNNNNQNNNNNNNNSANEYNELLYAHLLDADGNRLTYTHFTAKVERDSMIEIAFNRSVYIKANKVYRVGMVLNKVGWYPMGVCTRRVNCEGCFFTFCVGQPTDTLRDGLIRSIIFSK